MTFILSEDKALKAALQGITVTDDKNPQRPVGVWFGQPDVEIRQQSYPYITIDLIDVNEAVERQHRGHVYYDYAPDGYDPLKSWAGQAPIPINLDYQITSYARQPLHDRQIISQLLSEKTPFRFGLLHVADDSTVRRLDFLGFAKRDTTENDKRLFVNTINVRISSELIPYQLEELYEVGEIHLSLQQLFLSQRTTPA